MRGSVGFQKFYMRRTSLASSSYLPHHSNAITRSHTMIPRFHLIQPPQLRPNLRRQLRRRLNLPRPLLTSTRLLPTRLYSRLFFPIILIRSAIGPRRRLRLRRPRSRRCIIIADSKICLEFFRVRAADGRCGVAAGARRSSAGALGEAGGVGAGEGFLVGFLAGLFFCDARVNRVAEALYFIGDLWLDRVSMRVVWPSGVELANCTVQQRTWNMTVAGLWAWATGAVY